MKGGHSGLVEGSPVRNQQSPPKHVSVLTKVHIILPQF
jgi:hypothetical protein